MFPANAGVDHEEPKAIYVVLFHEHMIGSTAPELNLARVIHDHPHYVVVTGDEIKSQIGEGEEIEMDVWTAIWRLLRYLETKMYRGSFIRWRHIFEPQLAVELMGENLDFAFIEEMLSQDNLGYNLKFVRKSWSLYAIDVKNRYMLVMDPMETSEPPHEVRAKHMNNAVKVINNLGRAIRDCMEGWEVPSAESWTIEYNVGMHDSCTREQSGMYIVHYIKEFNGLTLRTPPSPMQIVYLRRQLAFQLAMMPSNKGEMSGWMKAMRNAPH